VYIDCRILVSRLQLTEFSFVYYWVLFRLDMRTISALASSVGCLAMLSTTVLADCAAYGMDFQDGGSYFQNSNSPDPFTFVSEFNGMLQENIIHAQPSLF
jgi:hypothetical protein